MEPILPACPRCGYDQSGAVATWAEACPLHGLCPECGYEFAWREVYRAQEQRNPRFVEHARRRGVPRAAWRTLAWAIIPSMFWRRVQLRHDVRGQRWLAWFLVTMLSVHLAGAACVVAGRWTFETRFVLPTGTPGLAPFDWWWVADAAGWPFIDVQGGFFGRFGIRNVVLGVKQWSAFSVFMATMSTLMMALVLALPQTRGRCKVRTAHVLRAAVFSWSWLVIPGALRLLVAGRWTFDLLVFGRDVDLADTYLLLHRYSLPLMGIGLAWQLAWWGGAMGRGWRMRGARSHAAALFAGAAAVAVLAVIAHDRSYAERLFIFTRSFGSGRGWRW